MRGARPATPGERQDKDMRTLLGGLAFLLLLASGLDRITPLFPVAGAQDSPETGECLIKGNISRSGERIYHVPGGRWYDVTRIDRLRGERWFCSEAEARAAGWRRSRR